MKTPKSCPICNDPLRYFYGDTMTDNTYSCDSKTHPDIYFKCETSYGFTNSLWIEIIDLNSDLKLRWACEKYGKIRPNMITIGTNFSPYDNEIITWEYDHPLMKRFKEIIKVLELMTFYG